MEKKWKCSKNLFEFFKIILEVYFLNIFTWGNKNLLLKIKSIYLVHQK